MAKDNIQVPYGYEPPVENKKGTLVVYDHFADVHPSGLAEVYRFAQERGFVRIVFYPIHELTASRMGITGLAPYHQRSRMLAESMEAAEKATGCSIPALVDSWEGKRKKYTPVEAALTFLTEKHSGPYFLWLPEQLAAKWAGYASFSQWIRRIRLVIGPPYGFPMPPVAHEYQNRWEYAR